MCSATHLVQRQNNVSNADGTTRIFCEHTIVLRRCIVLQTIILYSRQRKSPTHGTEYTPPLQRADPAVIAWIWVASTLSERVCRWCRNHVMQTCAVENGFRLARSCVLMATFTVHNSLSHTLRCSVFWFIVSGQNITPTSSSIHFTPDVSDPHELVSSTARPAVDEPWPQRAVVQRDTFPVVPVSDSRQLPDHHLQESAPSNTTNNFVFKSIMIDTIFTPVAYVCRDTWLRLKMLVFSLVTAGNFLRPRNSFSASWKSLDFTK